MLAVGCAHRGSHDRRAELLLQRGIPTTFGRRETRVSDARSAACGFALASPRQTLLPAPLLWKGAADGPFGALEDTAFTPTAPSATRTSTVLGRSSVLSGPWSSNCDLLRRNSPEPASCRGQQRALRSSPACREVAEGERGRHATREGSAGARHCRAKVCQPVGGARPPPTHKHQSPT